MSENIQQESLSLELYAEEIIDDEVQTSFSCWGSIACFMCSGTSTAGTGSTAACK